jgi:hypothetical protein
MGWSSTRLSWSPDMMGEGMYVGVGAKDVLHPITTTLIE